MTWPWWEGTSVKPGSSARMKEKKEELSYVWGSESACLLFDLRTRVWLSVCAIFIGCTLCSLKSRVTWVEPFWNGWKNHVHIKTYTIGVTVGTYFLTRLDWRQLLKLASLVFCGRPINKSLKTQFPWVSFKDPVFHESVFHELCLVWLAVFF